MEKKFTPGQWTSVTTDFNRKRHYGVAKLDDLGCGIALTGLVGDGDDLGSQANANLIAAAPELLEALETMVSRYVELVESGDCGFWDAEDEDQIINARKAIRKAYGET